jgi:2-polyprenyl-3-methyl-5-hydroxy-6-metoxy-1,4-benzoquinol methylase
MIFNPPPEQAQAGALLDEEWPTEGLQIRGACPVCGCAKRSALHTGLKDWTFLVAPGEWTMWRCQDCASGYLDPCPSESTIGLAYTRYLTHQGSSEIARLSFATYLRRAIGNDYRGYRYGADLRPRLRGVGRLITRLIPRSKKGIDLEYRFLPRCAQSSARLLDVGCGNGGFLRLAKNAGWLVAGVEPDPIAREFALAFGDVRSTVDEWDGEEAQFEYVTMSHVIEHVHDPAATLRAIFKLLKPGGGLYIQTPNINAPTHLRFGRAWRGLETPRHLQLFTASSLAECLARQDFIDISPCDVEQPVQFLVEQSTRIASGENPQTGEATNDPVSRGAFALQAEGEDEFITVVARKPS